MKNEVRRVSRYVSQKVWAIRESTLDVMVEILRMRAAGIELSQEEVQARIGAGPGRSTSNRYGAVGVLGLYGVISPRMNAFTSISGGTSLDIWMQHFRQLRDDQEVSGILIDGDTPGGNVHGLIEAADEIYKARAVKPITGIVHHMVASAGTWLMSACSDIVCVPSGEIGSIGCYMIHEDWSKANEKMGVKPTYISYGQYKTEGNFDNPIDDEALAYAQSQVNKVGQKFEKAVAKFRGVSVAKVRSDFGQGRLLMAEDALAVGLVDRIATFEDTLARMAGAKRRSMTAASATPAMSTEAQAGESTKCPDCGGSGLKPERAMGDPQGQEPCDTCRGTGMVNTEAEASTPAISAVKDPKAVEPDEDGNCPEGYQKRDGMCYPMEHDEEAKASSDGEALTIAAAAVAGD